VRQYRRRYAFRKEKWGCTMTSEQLTAILAVRVMGWRVGPDRFQTGNRGWLARGRFRPTERMQDAFRVLLAAEPSEYTIAGGNGKSSWARVRIDGAFGEASASSMPAAICLAVARAIGIEGTLV
jgi:hypothetical protein